jgi:hypothetical protein
VILGVCAFVVTVGVFDEPPPPPQLINRNGIIRQTKSLVKLLRERERERRL